MKKKINYFDELTKSLEQAVEFKKGDTKKPRLVVREIPVPEYGTKQISAIRHELNLTQKGLGVALGVSSRTVEAWESGKNKPTGSANKLLYLLSEDKGLIAKLILQG